ncbi:cytochrome c biogenesis heme-transporting ATPase CcmA [Paraburkholderia hayleyella]|uniref:cytochrome c biogenesis heme-transporting ATPase CcmA n=1 Tax=Paraburkholderia hayleyella TaxID=2152889 RepID=UPI001290C79C|nr:cytochrome c biogenesis heme-transporting ATPase CcmA [Paraburkholderia hayleyella]
MLKVERLGLGRAGRMVISDIGFEVAPGWALQVRGPNGSGKTTLLRMLAGLLAPSVGTVRWNGEDTRVSPSRWRRVLSYVAHANGVSDDLTVQENLDFAAALDGGTARADTGATGASGLECADTFDAGDILAHAGLERWRHARAGQLSQGQRRRIALVRLVLQRKPLWLLDEPATALDHTASLWFHEALARHLQAGGMVVAGVHQPLAIATERTRYLDLARSTQ